MKTPPTKRSSSGFILGKSGAYAVLILGLVATLLPFFYIIVSSLKTEAELRQTPPDFFPQEPTLKHYTTILTDEDIPIERNVINSVCCLTCRVWLLLFSPVPSRVTSSPNIISKARTLPLESSSSRS